MKLERLLKSSGIYAVGNALNRVGGFLLLPLYTHFLSTAEYGGLELLYATSSVVGSILSVGIASATLRFYFDYESETDRNAVITTNFLASLSLALGGSVLVWLAALPVFHQIFPKEISVTALAIIFLTMCFELSTEVLLAYIRARDLALFFVGISIVKLVLQCASNIYLVRFAHAGLFGVLTGNLIAVTCEWMILAAFVLRICGFAFHWNKFVPILKYCFPLLLTTMVGVVQGNFDRFYTGATIGLGALGVYAVAQKFTRIIIDFVGIPFSLAYGSFRFEMMKSSNAPKIQGELVVYLSSALTVIGLAMIYVIDEILHIMTDSQYWGASKLMPVMVSGAIASVLAGILQTGILYSKKTVLSFYLSVLGAVLGVILALLLTNRYGIQGVAASVAISSVIGMIATGWLSHKYLPTAYPRSRLLTLLALWVLFNAFPLMLELVGAAPSLLIDLALWLGFLAGLFGLRVLPISSIRESLKSSAWIK